MGWQDLESTSRHPSYQLPGTFGTGTRTTGVPGYGTDSIGPKYEVTVPKVLYRASFFILSCFRSLLLGVRPVGWMRIGSSREFDDGDLSVGREMVNYTKSTEILEHQR